MKSLFALLLPLALVTGWTVVDVRALGSRRRKPVHRCGRVWLAVGEEALGVAISTAFVPAGRVRWVLFRAVLATVVLAPAMYTCVNEFFVVGVD